MNKPLELLDKISIRRLYQDRGYNGLFASSFNEMQQAHKAEQFQKSVWMSHAVFDMLLELVKRRLTKMSNRSSNNITKNAFAIRVKLKDYIMSHPI